MGPEKSMESALKQQAQDLALPLTDLEALHAEAVLTATLEKLALIGVINVDPEAQAQALTQSVGDEIGRMLAEQRRLETRFEELVASQHELRRQPNQIKLRENEAQLAAVSEALRGATQHLCRNLKENLNVTDNMAKISRERTGLAAVLTATLRSLQQGQRDGSGSSIPTILPVIEAVMTHEQEEAAAYELSEAERAACAAVRQLRHELREEKAAHDITVKERRLALVALKEQLRGDKLRLAVDGRYHTQELAAANQCARRMHRADLAAASEQLSQLQQQIAMERAVNGAAVEHLGKVTGARQDDAVGWGSRREEDSQAKERQLEVVRAQHQRDTLRLRDLESRLNEELELKARRDERIREEAEAAERVESERRRRLRAATKIQAAWRGFKARRQAQGKKKGAAGKGKKGGAAKR